MSWAGPKRHRAPGVRFEDLPKIDVVLVTHNHYDHMDIPTLKRIMERDHPRIFTGLGNAAFLAEKGIPDAIDMDWWDEASVAEGVKIAFVPAVHFSARSMCDRNRTLWGGFVVKGTAGAVYHAGDTGMGPQFEEIRRRFGAPRVAFLPIGAFLPAWFMSPVHLSPSDAIEAHRLLGAETTVPIHYGTFKLGDDGQFIPVEYLARALADDPAIARQFLILNPGEGKDF